MAKTRNHPKRCKHCVFCNYWFGDANISFVSSTVGYEYEQYAAGKCSKTNSTTKSYQSCQRYAPNSYAQKLL